MYVSLYMFIYHHISPYILGYLRKSLYIPINPVYPHISLYISTYPHMPPYMFIYPISKIYGPTRDQQRVISQAPSRIPK